MTTFSWHSADVAAVLHELGSDGAHGLSAEEARQRLARFGPNELRAEHKVSPLALFLGQFRNLLLVILLVATALSAVVGELVDAGLILVIVLFSATLGFVQEYRAERSLEALKRMLAPSVTVRREGADVEIPSKELVPGDVIRLGAGDRVPADARLIEVHSLQCDEAPLTGESLVVPKHQAVVAEHVPLGDRRNMVFASTTVTSGRGRGVVTSTGMGTELGKIAEQVAEVEKDKTPLERRTEEIGKWVAIVSLATCLLVVAASFVRQLGVGEITVDFAVSVLIFAVALAVAAVSEALAAIVTGALAIGMHEMAKRKALVRKMQAVETLGCTTVICADKTGTLTKGEMTVRRIFVGGRTVEVGGSGYDPQGALSAPLDDPPARLLLTAGALCNDAELVRDDERWIVRGDPTEAALLVLAAKGGVSLAEASREHPRLAELPFSSERKRMTTVHAADDGTRRAFVKGAPEIILERSTSVLDGERAVPMDATWLETLHRANEEMASRALRVVGLAYRDLRDGDGHDDALETGLVFLGLVGMMDPPREEAIRAVQVCREIHVRPVMITGDHRLTAEAVAKEIGILREGDLVLGGDELERLDEEGLAAVVERVSVYARVSPLDKLKIVRAWKQKGDVVAMTGDGVNDAPALKHADIGVAMGITGTEVAKEASDVVLLDDNFATIVRAIELGRWIYDNIKKYLAYLLRANLTEVIVLGGVALALGPEFLPLLPAAILYVNLATDGLPALALGVAPPDPDIMKRPPRDPRESVFSRDMLMLVVTGVLLQCPIFLWVFFRELPDLELARTQAFLLFVVVELIIALNFRSLRYGLLAAPPHKWLLLSIAWELLLLGGLIQLPAVRDAFGIGLPRLPDLGLVLAVGFAVLLSVEVVKAWLRRTPAAARRGRGLASPARNL